MAEVQLSQGPVVFVDDADLGLVAGHAWRLDTNGYAQRKFWIGSDQYGWELMHRLIIGAKPGEVVDHIDQNQLNNRRGNLRIATKSQNACNTKKQPGKSSKHKGVTRSKTAGRWIAQIFLNQKCHHLGTFSSEDEAAHEYNKAAIRLHGEFACLNPIGEDK